MRTLLIAAVLAGAAPAWASGGFAIDEQSARGTGMAGAQTAVADDAAAIFYNPAGIANQSGFNALAGSHLVYVATKVETHGETVRPSFVTLIPHLYVSQRFGRHLAIGFGAFTQFDEHFGYPTHWKGRFLGQFIDLTTATFNPTLALRFSRVAIGGGADIVPAQLDAYRALNFGGGEGTVRAGLTAVGIGGNVGVLLELWPKRLSLGVSYRSRIDLDFGGHGAVYGPVELRALTGGLQVASTSLVLPHNLAAGLALRANHHLLLAIDGRVVWWRDQQRVILTLADPQAPPGTPPLQQTVEFDFKNSWNLRVGGEYRVLERLALRIGAGYDSTPLPASRLGPLLPDSERVVVTGGLGWHTRIIDFDAGYLCGIFIKRTAENPDLRATYGTIANLFTFSASVRLPDVGKHIGYDER